MNLFRFTTGRVRPGSRRAGRLVPSPGRLYNIRYAMTPRGPRRDEVQVRVRPLLAAWTRDPVTGALICRWHASFAQHTADLPTTSAHSLASMPRRDLHADMRPPTR